MNLDMHLHSNFSLDGKAPPRDILKQARKNGLEGLCITDHNTLNGNAEARKIAHEFGILVISGMEISSSHGHILAYGIREEIPRDLSPEDTLDRIRAQGGMAVIAHPFRYWSGLGASRTLSVKPDAIEALNAHSTGRDNGMARKLADRMKLPVTGGSDSHELPSIGSAFTVIQDAENEDDVLKLIRAGKAKVGGQSRNLSGNLRDRTVGVTKWMRRGFRKM